jgi:ABC-type uncharacterized transport system ATPase subunit
VSPAPSLLALDPGRPVVRLERIVKAFGAVVALREVSLDLAGGEIRALLGENGAGKTTLMRVLYGTVRPDAGRVVVGGEDVTAGWSPRRAIARGIGMIHQHFALVDAHTALENIVLPVTRWTHLAPDWPRHRAAVARLCGEYGFGVPLDARLDRLSVGERQQVEILKVLYQGARVLVLDEPTSVLAPQQTDALLAMLERLRAQGHTVVLITHKLREALAVSTRITVLRHGAHVATIERSAATADDIARMMTDRALAGPRRPAAVPRGAPVLEIEDLTVAGAGEPAVDGLTLAVGAGEVVGVAGVAGNGQNELAQAIVGYRGVERGAIRLDGHDVTGLPIRKRLARGIAFVPEDRHHLGMVGPMSVADNLILDRAGDARFARWRVLRRTAIAAHAAEQLRRFDIRAPGPQVAAAALSGGNQQKVVLSRALGRDPRVVVAAEPTRGLDPGATGDVRRRLLACAERGTGVLLVSGDLEELMALSHRIVVMYRGRIAGELARDAFDAHRIGQLMVGLGAPAE